MKWHGFIVFMLCLGTSSLFAQGTLPAPTKSGTGKAASGAATAPPATSRGTGTQGSGASAPKGTGATTQPGSPAASGATTRPQNSASTTTPASGSPAATKGAPAATKGGPAAGISGQTARDYASYAIGLDMAARFQADETPVNVELLIQGMKDGFSGAKPRFSEAQLRAAAEAFDKEMQLRAQERFKLTSERNKKDGAAFLAENKKKKTVKSLPSGLQYEVLKAGTGKSPKLADKIKAHYHGTLVDGTVFDTTQDDQPVEIEVNSAIAGWTEALQIMKVGDKWRLFVPSELAYGADGFGPVPPNAVLIFDLELIEVVPSTPNTGTPVGQGTLPRPIK